MFVGAVVSSRGGAQTGFSRAGLRGDTDFSPEDYLTKADEYEKALKSLSDLDLWIWLSHRYGKTYKQIAAAMGELLGHPVSVMAICTRMGDIRTKLKKS